MLAVLAFPAKSSYTTVLHLCSMANRKSLRNLFRVLRYLDDLHEGAYAKYRSKETDRFEISYVSRTKIADDLKINYDTMNELIMVLNHASLVSIDVPSDGSLHLGLVQEWRDSFLHDAVSAKDVREYYGLESDPKPTPQERSYRQLIESADGGFLIPISDEEALKAPFDVVIKSKTGSFTLHVDPTDE